MAIGEGFLKVTLERRDRSQEVSIIGVRGIVLAQGGAWVGVGVGVVVGS